MSVFHTTDEIQPDFDNLTSSCDVVVDTAGPFQRQTGRTASYRLERDPQYESPEELQAKGRISGKKVRKCFGIILMVVIITTLAVAMVKVYGERSDDELPTTTQLSSGNATKFETPTSSPAMNIDSMSTADVTST